MKAYKFNKQTGEELKAKMMEFIGQLTMGEVLTLQQQLTDDNNKKAEVHFSSEAYYKMYALVDECDKEIAWDGIVYRDEEDPSVFYVKDIIVYPQKVSGATVETDDEQYLNWLNSLDDETFNHRRFNGHSHVRMATSPSGVDTTYREQSVLNIKDFFIFGIFNKSKSFNFQIYDIENNVIYENGDIIFYTPEPDYSAWAKSVIKEKVTEKKYTTPATTGVRVTGAGSAVGTNANSEQVPNYWYQRNLQGRGYGGYGYDYD